MSRSFSEFDIRQTEENEWQLLKPFVYHDSVFGAIVVPEGFKTNFASIESLRLPLFPLYAMLANYGDRAATVHDYLYGGHPIEVNGLPRYLWRAEADDVLYRALRAEGIARWRARMFWAGVRMGGESFFSLDKKPFTPPQIKE